MSVPEERVMWTRSVCRYLIMVSACLWMSAQASAESLKPFILGDTPPGDLKLATEAVKTKLTQQGFEIVGSYSPFAGAMGILAPQKGLKNAGGQGAHNGDLAPRMVIGSRRLEGCQRGGPAPPSDPGGPTERESFSSLLVPKIPMAP